MDRGVWSSLTSRPWFQGMRCSTNAILHRWKNVTIVVPSNNNA